MVALRSELNEKEQVEREREHSSWWLTHQAVAGRDVKDEEVAVAIAHGQKGAVCKRGQDSAQKGRA